MKSLFWRYIGFCMVFYMIFLVTVWAGYPFIQEYIKPVASFIFPINETNSLPKTLIAMTGMYWAMVIGYYFINTQKPE